MGIVQVDQRGVNITDCDFGFGKPLVYRCMGRRVDMGVVLIYLPRAATLGSDEACEFSVSVEKELALDLIDDAGFKTFLSSEGEMIRSVRVHTD